MDNIGVQSQVVLSALNKLLGANASHIVRGFQHSLDEGQSAPQDAVHGVAAGANKVQALKLPLAPRTGTTGFVAFWV